MYRRVPRRLSLVTAGLWALYGLYEYGMKLRVLCSGECNIRVDLLLIYPTLVLCSVIALGQVLLGQRGNGNGEKRKGR